MKKITVSILSLVMMLSMVFSSSVFAANEQPSAWNSFLGLFNAKAASDDVGVEYRGHVQNKGDFPTDGSWIQGPNRLGTVGESLRLEAFWIKLTDAPAGLHIKYEVHVQNIGWMAPVEDGDMAGTEGDALRIEAIKISLVDDAGVASKDYSVSYKGHVQNIGDTAWYKDGAQLGTTGSNLRLEALEVKIEKIPSDLTAYEAALAAVTEANYTKASWATYQAVVAANVMTTEDVQSAVDAATAAITDAQEDLVTVPVIAGMTATAQKAITVTGTELSKLSAAMLAVTGNTITAVTPSADGTSAVLTLGTDLPPATNVKVTATIDGTATDYTVNFKVEALNVVVQDATFDMFQKNQQLTVLVNGVATTPAYLQSQGYTVTFNSWNSSSANANVTLFGAAANSTGIIAVPQSTTPADFTAQVTLSQGSSVVTSNVATVKIRNLTNNVTEISSVTMKKNVSGTDTIAISSGKLVVGESARITKVVVGFGDAATELTPVTGGYTISSSNTAVANVSSTTSAAAVITATGLGSANIIVTAGEVTYTLPITVTGTARAVTSVALKNNAATFTAIIGNGVTNTMTVVVKDQYGDPFYSTVALPIAVTTPTNITGLTALTTPIPSTSDKGEYGFGVVLGATAVSGESGNAVFRNSTTAALLGTATIVTSGNNVATTMGLKAVDGSTTNTITTDLASAAFIKYQVRNLNSSGVDVGQVTNLNNYTVTVDSSIIDVAQNGANLVDTAGVHTLGAVGSDFTITGKKAGTATMLVKSDTGAVVESRTITVAQGQVTITGASFLSPGTIANIGTVNYANVMPKTATSGDPILTGITTTPSTVYAIKLSVTAGSYGVIYLDKTPANASYAPATDTQIGTLTCNVAPSTSSTTWNAVTDSVTGLLTRLGNKGTLTFVVTDVVSSTPVVVATTGVVIDVPSTTFSVTGVTVASNNAVTTLAKAANTVTYTITTGVATTATINTVGAANNIADAVTTDLTTTSGTSKTIVFTVAGGDNGAVTMSAGDYTLTDGTTSLTLTAAQINAMATGTVTADTTQPKITGITNGTGNTAVVVFDEAMNKVAAETVGNWTLTDATTISGVSLSADGKTATVTFVAPLADAATLLAKPAVIDLAGNAVDLTKDLGTYTLATTSWVIS